MSFDELYEQMDEKGANRYPVGKLIHVKPGELGDVQLRPGKDVEDLKSQMTENGWVVPISITADGFIVDGAHRYLALTELGFTEIPAYVGEQMGGAGRLKNVYPGLPIRLNTLKRKQ